MKKYIPTYLFLIFLGLFFLAYHSISASMAETATANEQLTAANSIAPQSGSAHMAGDIQVNFDQSELTAEGAANVLTDNWGVIVLGLLTFAETIVRLTPTQKDNTILKFLVTIFDAIVPNKKKGGGVF
jgi:hypothetical protein